MRELLIQYYKNIQKFLMLGNDEEYDQELDSDVQRLEKDFHNEIDKRPTTAEYEFEGVDAVEGLFDEFPNKEDRINYLRDNYIPIDFVLNWENLSSFEYERKKLILKKLQHSFGILEEWELH